MGKFDKPIIGKPRDEDNENKKLNLGIAQFGYADPAFDSDDVADGSDEEYSSTTFGPGWEEIDAPTTYSKRPRALKCGYSRKLKMLVIVFRPKVGKNRNGEWTAVSTEPWIKYEEVDLEMWEELKTYHSTGEWLKFSGVEDLPYSPSSRSELNQLSGNKVKLD
jgi:hypothetical protein